MERLGPGAGWCCVTQTHGMTILINGENEDALGAENIQELVERFGLPPQTVLIEHNGLALHRREWPKHRLSEGDRIELLRVVAGG